MVAAVDFLLLLVVLGLHTLIAAIATRYFRVRLRTTWGWVIYTLLLVPVLLTVGTLFFTGLLGIGPNLGSPAVVLAVLVGVPMALGAAIDLLYVRPPEEVDLPDTQGR